MDPGLVRSLAVGAFGMHGLGMLGAAGYLPFDRKRAFIGTSWVLGAGFIATVLGVAIWGVAGVAYLVAAYGFWTNVAWWSSAALVGALFTLVAVALWLGKVPPGVYVGGLLAIATVIYLRFG